MQDFYARKRKKSLAEEGTEKIRANFKQSRHPQLRVTDEVKEAEAAKAKTEPVDEATDALDTRRQVDIKKDHESLMGKSTDEVLRFIRVHWVRFIRNTLQPMLVVKKEWLPIFSVIATVINMLQNTLVSQKQRILRHCQRSRLVFKRSN